MYAAAAAEQREEVPLPRPGLRRQNAPRAYPVGVHHAVAAAFVGDPRPAALCGANIRGWLVFSAVLFDTNHAAACQRRGQLVAATTNTTQNRARRTLRPSKQTE
jgi:hypothetical protein